MTIEGIYEGVMSKKLSIQDAYDAVTDPVIKKKINYYSHFNDIAKEPLNDGQLQELSAIVGVLQVLYDSDLGSPLDDPKYDTLQEILVNMGIPRNTGSIEINDQTKVNHKYTKLRGTLDKVYYLSMDEKRVNKSRKYLDEWIKSTEALYKKKTGKDIDLNSVKIILTPKFDGVSAIMETGDDKVTWITRGDTNANLASDVTKIMNVFNDVYTAEPETGQKFEVMVSEDNRDKINQLYAVKPYKNSRQIAIATVNSNEPDFKVDYIYPVPLRIIHSGDRVEDIHPDMLEKFPTEVCTFGDRETIRAFANRNRYVEHDGMRFRTDGVVLTIIDEDLKVILGRDDNINNFEVAYKFTEESAYTRVKDVEFEPSDFGYICPVLIVNDVILKGNKVGRISLSNKERFDELDLSYGDEVKVLYDIIPYVTIDESCHRVKNGRKIEFVKRCPKCNEPLDLNVVQVRCANPECPSKIIGRIQNYCDKLRIKNIGYSTLMALYNNNLLKHGIVSLYKLKKHRYDIGELEGFGDTKAKKIISEVNAKRKLNDYEFFGALGINGISTTTFGLIFKNIKLNEFMDMIRLKNFDLMKMRMIAIDGIGPTTADTLIESLKNKKFISEVNSILKEVVLYSTFNAGESDRRITFTGCRPDDEMISRIRSAGYTPSDSWSDKLTEVLVIPDVEYYSSKVDKARNKGVKIIPVDELYNFLGKEVE